ncbi:MAG: hypothetical protein HY436_01495 [Candidatus Liptonbacteria bacterium]|nr:hypothetical protein [Candidatus Liptonbacteria bacterium]
MRVLRFAVRFLVALATIFAVAQVVLFPIRWQSCQNISKAAALTPNENIIRLRSIMCSPKKFLGITDVSRTLSVWR